MFAGAEVLAEGILSEGGHWYTVLGEGRDAERQQFFLGPLSHTTSYTVWHKSLGSQQRLGTWRALGVGRKIEQDVENLLEKDLEAGDGRRGGGNWSKGTR